MLGARAKQLTSSHCSAVLTQVDILELAILEAHEQR